MLRFEYLLDDVYLATSLRHAHVDCRRVASVTPSDGVKKSLLPISTNTDQR